jgi:PIN domain nuclease of toxin-antitoxin system
VVIWLYAGLTEKFSEVARDLISRHGCLISPMVRLELQYLYEIGRINQDAVTICTDLEERIGLSLCQKEFASVVERALPEAWTRDPFDRLIVAHAALDGDLLISKDQSIRDHYPHARW